jgi:hypothetical protein
MLNENILWQRAISANGKLFREPTFLGAVLIIAGSAVALGVAFYVIVLLSSFL